MQKTDLNEIFRKIMEGKRKVNQRRKMTEKDMLKSLQSALTAVITQVKKNKKIYEDYNMVEFSIGIDEEGLVVLRDEVVFYKEQQKSKIGSENEKIEHLEIAESFGRKARIRKHVLKFFEEIVSIDKFTLERTNKSWSPSNSIASIYCKYR